MIFLDTLDDPLVAGDDYDIRRQVVDLPEGDSIAEAWLTLKTDALPASAIVLQKHITTSEEAGVGQIIDDSLGLELLFQITAVDSALLDPYTRYVYDIQVLTANGKRWTRERGVVTPKAQITTT